MNRRADPDTVAQVRKVAGDGTTEDRCRNILTHYRHRWCGHPYTPGAD